MDLEYVDIRDEATPQRNGSVLHQKVARFYIGKFGPFTERLPPETWEAELATRVARLRATLENLPR